MPITIDGTGNITGLSAGGLPDLSVTNADLATNAVSTSKVLDGAITTTKLGSNEQSGLCKAFVNFNGTGVVAIRASYNVSSITDNGTGDYTVNFTSALVDANYTPVCTSDNNSPTVGNGNIFGLYSSGTVTTTALRVSNKTPNSPANAQDMTYQCVAIFR